MSKNRVRNDIRRNSEESIGSKSSKDSLIESDEQNIPVAKNPPSMSDIDTLHDTLCEQNIDNCKLGNLSVSLAEKEPILTIQEKPCIDDTKCDIPEKVSDVVTPPTSALIKTNTPKY